MIRYQQQGPVPTVLIPALGQWQISQKEETEKLLPFCVLAEGF